MNLRAPLSAIRVFARRQEGTVAILFALTIIPLVLVAGMSMDYLNAMRLSAALQASVDGAALTVARLEGLEDERRKRNGLMFFLANFPKSDEFRSSLFITIGATAVETRARIFVPTTLMKLAGVRQIMVERSAEVPRLTQSKAEVVLVTDFSGSMRDNDKYIRMKRAATDLIDTLEDFAADGNLKVGLVPFSGMVRVTLPNDHVVGLAGPGTWTGCTEDRRFPFNRTDDEPVNGEDHSKWGELKGPELAAGVPCATYEANNVTIAPLSANLADIRARLAAMQPVRYTHIALGAEFGWHLLSPNAPFTEAVDYTDKQTRKSIIILTDGMQTSPGWGPGESSTISNAEENLVSICQNMKSKDIDIYTIGYDLDDETTLNRLRNCASPDKFYDASNSEADISAVFDSIGISIMESMLRLSK